MAEYVQIGEGVEGFAYYDTDTNELVTLDADVPGTTNTSLRPATKAEIEGARRGFAAQSATQKARGLAETAISGATFGLITDRSPEAEARRQVLGQENPVARGLANVAGTLGPALLGGAVVGGVARALGAGARGAAVATFVGEEAAQGGALALSQAAETDGEVDVGSVFQGMAEGAAFLGAARLLRRGVRAGRAKLGGADEVELRGAGRAELGGADEVELGAGPDAALARGQAEAKAA